MVIPKPSLSYNFLTCVYTCLIGKRFCYIWKKKPIEYIKGTNIHVSISLKCQVDKTFKIANLEILIYNFADSISTSGSAVTSPGSLRWKPHRMLMRSSCRCYVHGPNFLKDCLPYCPLLAWQTSGGSTCLNTCARLCGRSIKTLRAHPRHYKRLKLTNVGCVFQINCH